MKDRVVEIYKRVGIYQIINIVLFLLITLFLNPTYDVYDDQTMAYIAMGVYGKQDFHLIFINVIIGKLLVFLFSIFPGLNWHVALYEVLVLIAITMLINMFEKKCEKKFHTFPIILVIYMFAVSYYYYVQFSKCAGLLPVVGLLYSIYLTELGERKWYKYILPGALIVVGTFYRFEVIYMIGFIFIPILLYVFLKADKRQKTCLFVYGTLVLVLAFGFRIVDKAIYYADDDWAYYLEYNKNRAGLMDYGWPDYYNNVEKFEELGISIVDYDNFQTWDFGDRDLFNLDVLKALIEIRDSEESVNLWSRYCLVFIPGFLEYSFAGFFFLSIAYLLMHGKGNRKYIGFTSVGIFFLAELVLVYRGRYLQYRIDVSAGLAIIAICFYLAVKNSESESMKRSNWLFAVATSIVAIFAARDIPVDIVENRSIVQNNQEINQLLREDEDSIYIVGTSSGGVCTTNIWGAIEESDYSNIFRLGGWLTESPIFREQLEKAGIENLYSAMIDGEDVYCVDNVSYGYKLAYLRENYNANVDMILVKNIQGKLLWKVVTKGLDVELADYNDGMQVLNQDVAVSYTESGIQVEGVVYEPDTNSYKQNMYVVISDKESGIDKAYYVTQTVNETSEDKMNGRYAAFYTKIDMAYTGEERIYILVENENGNYYIECK